MPPEELKSFIIHALEEIGIKLSKSQIVACHKLGKSERTIIKFLNRKSAENILPDKKKFRDIYVSEIVIDALKSEVISPQKYQMNGVCSK